MSGLNLHYYCYYMMSGYVSLKELVLLLLKCPTLSDSARSDLSEIVNVKCQGSGIDLFNQYLVLLTSNSHSSCINFHFSFLSQDQLTVIPPLLHVRSSISLYFFIVAFLYCMLQSIGYFVKQQL